MVDRLFGGEILSVRLVVEGGETQIQPLEQTNLWPGEVYIGDTRYLRESVELKAIHTGRGENKPLLRIKITPPGADHPTAQFELDGGLRDRSYLASYLAAQLASGLGLPTPRVGHARVSLNGVELGLYIVTEGITACTTCLSLYA